MMVRVVVLMVVALAGTGLAPVASAESAASDWVLVEITAGPDGAESVRSEFELTVEVIDGASLLWGRGWGSSEHGSIFLDTWPISSDEPIQVSTSRELGGVRQELIPSPVSGGGFRLSHSFSAGRLDPGETHAFLEFFPGGTITDFYAFPAAAREGSVEMAVTSGTGSTALRVGDPEAGGPGAAAGSATAGVASHSLATEVGLAGAFTSVDFCLVCTASWEGPDGGGSFTDADGPLGLQSPAFADGPGGWQWTWAGAGFTRSLIPINAPAYAAYAPVGDAWTLFRTD